MKAQDFEESKKQRDRRYKVEERLALIILVGVILLNFYFLLKLIF